MNLYFGEIFGHLDDANNAPASVTPGVLALTLTTFAPAATLVTGLSPAATMLTLTGYAPTAIVGVAYFVEVDWDGDGNFTNANSQIAPSTFDVQCTRGRDYASQLTGRAVAGNATLTLDNRDGKFSSFNASSPIYGKILPNRKVRIRATPGPVVLWTGFLDHIDVSTGGRPMATLYAVGAFQQLGSQANLISPLPQQGVQTDTVLGVILDAAGWPSDARTIDAGYIPVGNWFKEQAVALTAAQEIEDTEQGFVYEGLNWDIVFENRYHRITSSRSTTSQAMFTDAIAAGGGFHYEDAHQQDPIREIYNLCTAQVQPYNPGALAVLWTLSGDTIALAPGESRVITARYNNGYAFPWTTPVVGTDLVLASGVVANGDIAVTLTVKTAQSMAMTIKNNHASATATFATVQARGIPVTAANPVQVQASDATSQTAYGKRSYPLPSPWWPNAAYAQAGVDLFINLKKDPHPILELTIPAGTNLGLFEQAQARQISDRISNVATGFLTELGITGDFFIEGITHKFGARTPMSTTWLLSPASVQTYYWILGDSTYGVLGSTTKLAF